MKTRVYVLEDEPVIALELEGFLDAAGYEVVGTSGSVDGALADLRTLTCDVAVIDCNLRGESPAAVASTLAERLVPMVFVSGYGRQAITYAYPHAPFVSKPLTSDDLVGTIEKLLRHPPAATGQGPSANACSSGS